MQFFIVEDVSDPSGEVAALNEQMVPRLLDEPGQAPTEGSYVLQVLQTRGRRSGRARRTPVAVVRHQGRDHLVCPDPRRDWVRNLRAHPLAALLTRDTNTAVVALGLPAQPAALVVATYLRAITVPWALCAFPVAADASLAEIATVIPPVTVFGLEADRDPQTRHTDDG